MAPRKKTPPRPVLSEEERRALAAEYQEAYEIMAKCGELGRFRKVIEDLPKRRAAAPDCPEAGLPVCMTESDVLQAIERLEQELTPERRQWMCKVMARHMPYFNASVYLDAKAA
ncbi:hypothetical protein [Azospirillum sp.]|uniref:hypothetical protein n=1 Tax=Azospirillum sp. TaxID=34012 RepID=UPI003D75F2CE